MEEFDEQVVKKNIEEYLKTSGFRRLSNKSSDTLVYKLNSLIVKVYSNE